MLNLESFGISAQDDIQLPENSPADSHLRIGIEGHDEQLSTLTDTPSRPLPFPDGVKMLHDYPDAVVDICFIHGLTGNRDTTWTARGQATPWPAELLPPKLQKARILTFGYDAYIAQKSISSTNRLIDHATNLLNDF